MTSSSLLNYFKRSETEAPPNYFAAKLLRDQWSTIRESLQRLSKYIESTDKDEYAVVCGCSTSATTSLTKARFPRSKRLDEPRAGMPLSVERNRRMLYRSCILQHTGRFLAASMARHTEPEFTLAITRLGIPSSPLAAALLPHVAANFRPAPRPVPRGTRFSWGMEKVSATRQRLRCRFGCRCRYSR